MTVDVDLDLLDTRHTDDVLLAQSCVAIRPGYSQDRLLAIGFFFSGWCVCVCVWLVCVVCVCVCVCVWCGGDG